MSESSEIYDANRLGDEIHDLLTTAPVEPERPERMSLRTIYSTESQVTELFNLAQFNEEPSISTLCAGFLLLHKDLDRIATALEMRNQSDTADMPLSRRLRAVRNEPQP